MLEPLRHDFLAGGLAARASLSQDEGGPGGGLRRPGTTATTSGRSSSSRRRSAAPDQEQRDLLRKVMVAIFTELGPESELASRYRRRLASALN